MLSILMYYILLGAVVLTILTNSLLDLEEFKKAVTAYFTCEATGIQISDIDDNMMHMENNSQCEEEREEFKGLLNPIPTTIAFTILGLYPLMNLLYTVNVKELKKKFALKERKVEAIRRSREERLTIHSMMRANPVSPITFKGIGGNDRGLINFNAAAASGSPIQHGPITSSFSSGNYTTPSTFRPIPSQ